MDGLSLNILIINHNATTTAHLLRSLQQGSITATWQQVTTEAALQAALDLENTWDIILAHEAIPHLKITVILAIARRYAPHIPCLVIGHAANHRVIVEAMRAGARDYILNDELARLPEVIRREVQEAQAQAYHQQTARELALMQERLNLAVEAAELGLWDWLLPENALIINAQWIKSLGYEVAEFSPLDHAQWKELIHPDDQAPHEAATDEHLNGQTELYECEFRIRHAEGHWLWLLSRGRVIEWDAAGNPKRMTGSHLNITPRKEAEAALQQSQTRLLEAQRISQLGTWDFEIATGTLQWSDEIYRIFELPLQSEVNLDRWLKRVHPDDRDRIATAFQTFPQTITEELIYRLECPSGQTKYVRDLGRSITDDQGRLIRLAGTVQDITVSYVAEQEQARVNRILQLLIQGTSAVTGANFFNELVRHIAQALNISHVAISEATDTGLAVLAFWSSGELQPTALWAYGDAPCCCQVMRQGKFYGDHLLELFPDNDLLNQLHIESYLGIALRNSEGRPIGVLCLMEEGPLTNPEWLDSLMRTFAARASAELERLQMGRALEALNLELEARVHQRTAELQASQHFSERIIDTTPHILYIYDLTQRCNVYMNREVTQILGYTPAEILDLGTEILAYLIHPEDLPQVQAHHRQLATATDNQIAEVEYRMRDRDSNWYWFISRDVVFERDRSTGHGTQILGSAINITERKAIEVELKQSQERTQATLSALPDIIFRLDHAQRHLDFFVPEHMRSVAYNPLAVIGKTLAEVCPPAIATRYAQALETVLNTQTIEVYEQQVCLNGKQHYEEVRVAPCGRNEAVFLIRDITDRREAEHQLQTSEAELSALFAAISDSIVVRDRVGRCLKIAPHSKNLYLPPEQMLGRTLHEVFPPATADYLLDKVRECVDTQTTIPAEYALQIRDRTVYLSANISPLSSEAAVIVARDVSDRQAYETQLQKTNTELRRATRLKDEFLANMSHELRTPLNAILGMTEGLLDNAFGPLSERQRYSLKTIERSGRHLLDLINDILDLSKIEAGKMELELTSVTVRNLCDTSLTLMRQIAHKKQIHLALEIPSHLADLTLTVDDRRLRQVLLNLLSNAIKFTPNGGNVTLTVTLTPSPHPEASPATLDFTVSDTGIGIAPENIDQLFQTFVQIDSQLNRQYEGTGLGLALVKRLTEMHGGVVTVTSTPNQGSCFTVKLPFSPSLHKATSSRQGVSSAESTGNNQLQDVGTTALHVTSAGATATPLVLLVEDNEANRYSIGGYLEAKGYQLAFANDGYEAIAQVQTLNPDIILMDVQMPGMDGLEATQRIRSLPHCATIPILALTALAMPEDRDRCLAAGASEYLAKPVKLKELVTIINTLLQGNTYVG